jgi:pimeloyl-ACP methyl ester carboxylesterase
MGYRLSSAAWPAEFVASLARQFTVITPDNRGSGMSDKPLAGYAIANMARDLAALLVELKIECAHVLGYQWAVPLHKNSSISSPCGSHA